MVRYLDSYNNGSFNGGCLMGVMSMDKKAFKKKIEAEIQSLEEMLPKLEQSAKPVELDQSSVGRVSRIDALGNQAISEQALAKAQTKVKALKGVLEHIDDEDFGDCVVCGQPIPEKRLLVMPEHMVCVKCA